MDLGWRGLDWSGLKQGSRTRPGLGLGPRILDPKPKPRPRQAQGPGRPRPRAQDTRPMTYLHIVFYLLPISSHYFLTDFREPSPAYSSSTHLLPILLHPTYLLPPLISDPHSPLLPLPSDLYPTPTDYPTYSYLLLPTSNQPPPAYDLLPSPTCLPLPTYQPTRSPSYSCLPPTYLLFQLQPWPIISRSYLRPASFRLVGGVEMTVKHTSSQNSVLRLGEGAEVGETTKSRSR